MGRHGSWEAGWGAGHGGQQPWKHGGPPPWVAGLLGLAQAGATRVPKVKRGDVLGKVGNTGNTQAPHLHLHVMDGPSPLLSNGIPYVFDSFKLVAIDKAGTADFDKAEATGSPLTLTPVSPPQVLSRVLPLDLTVVEFSR